jgi:hypothetical protein
VAAWSSELAAANWVEVIGGPSAKKSKTAYDAGPQRAADIARNKGHGAFDGHGDGLPAGSGEDLAGVRLPRDWVQQLRRPMRGGFRSELALRETPGSGLLLKWVRNGVQPHVMPSPRKQTRLLSNVSALA